MHIWVNSHWDYVNGVLLGSEQKAGTVRTFDPYAVSEEKKQSDWVIMKPPQLWVANTDQQHVEATSQLVNATKAIKESANISLTSMNAEQCNGQKQMNCL